MTYPGPAPSTSFTQIFMEDILYESAKFNLQQTQTISAQRTIQAMDLTLLKNEIQFSASTIIASINCLEAYINSILENHFRSQPKEVKEYARGLRIKTKWYLAPLILGNPNTFDVTTSPFVNFRHLNSYRNEVIHWDAVVPTPQSGRYPIPALRNLNVRNAELAVRTIKEMINTFCTFTGLTLPSWLI